MNIYQRLNKVREAVSYIQKDATVTGYKAITHDMVTSVVRPELIKHGVLIVPYQISQRSKDTGKTTSSGTPFTMYEGMYKISFVNIDDPDEKVVVKVGAQAEDHGDKGPGKCISYATKTAILKVLSIETGESDESRQEQKIDLTPIDEKQKSQIVAMLDDVGASKADTKKFLKYLENKAKSEIKDIESIPAVMFKVAVTALEAKKDAQIAAYDKGE